MVLAAVIILALTSSEVRKVEMRWPGWGFTHTQFSADSGSVEAVASVQRALANSLDHRIDFIRQAGGIEVVTGLVEFEVAVPRLMSALR